MLHSLVDSADCLSIISYDFFTSNTWLYGGKAVILQPI